MTNGAIPLVELQFGAFLPVPSCRRRRRRRPKTKPSFGGALNWDYSIS